MKYYILIDTDVHNKFGSGFFLNHLSHIDLIDDYCFSINGKKFIEQFRKFETRSEAEKYAKNGDYWTYFRHDHKLNLRPAKVEVKEFASILRNKKIKPVSILVDAIGS